MAVIQDVDAGPCQNKFISFFEKNKSCLERTIKKPFLCFLLHLQKYMLFKQASKTITIYCNMYCYGHVEQSHINNQTKRVDLYLYVMFCFYKDNKRFFMLLSDHTFL